MLNYPTLAKKPSISMFKDGKKYNMLDLMSLVYKGNPNVYGNTIRVTKEYVARPDLVSLAVYGTDNYGDLLCKVNGISNPFELNENMLLFIPLEEFLSDMVVIIGSKSELISPKSKINSNGINDNIFKEFSTSMLSNRKLKENFEEDITTKKNDVVSTIGKSLTTNKKLKNERRSPAEQTINDNNYVIDKSLGIVIY